MATNEFVFSRATRHVLVIPIRAQLTPKGVGLVENGQCSRHENRATAAQEERAGLQCEGREGARYPHRGIVDQGERSGG